MDLLEQFNRNSRSAWQSVRRLGDINSEAVRRLTEVQVNVLNLGIDGSTEQAKIAATNPGYGDYFAAQADFGSRYGSKVVSVLREVSDIVNDTKDETVNWFEGCISDVQESTTAAARQAKDMVKA